MTNEAPELLPCPFCGGEAEIVDAVEAGEQAKVVCCKKCMASSRVIFALMDDVTLDLVSAWNKRVDHLKAAVAAERGACAEFFDAKAKAMRSDSRAAHQGEALAVFEYASKVIRARTDADALAALEQVKREAEQRGYANAMEAERKDADQRIKEALREAAEIAFEADDCYLARNGILALLDKEPGQ